MTTRVTPFKRFGSLGKLTSSAKLINFIIFLAIIIAVASLVTWWRFIYNSPERVFWSMIDNNLKTSSFARTVLEGAPDSGQSTLQVSQTWTEPVALTSGKSIITQSAPNNARVVTEAIGTPTTDYVRYTEVSTNQKNATGGKLNFSSITNVWGKTDPVGGVTNGQQYGEAVLGVVPFGNLTLAQRKALVKLMHDKKVYVFTVAKRDNVAPGRTSYVFDVQISPEGYVAALKAYAHDVGLSQLEDIDPAQYANSQPISVQMRVDGWTHQLTQVSYGGGARSENVGSYNLAKAAPKLPTKTIPVQDLQTRLQSIQ
jgi:hypothetical protein